MRSSARSCSAPWSRTKVGSPAIWPSRWKAWSPDCSCPPSSPTPACAPQIGLVQGPQQWLLCGLIIVAATLGKFGGTYFAARLTGLDSRTGATLGVLMNTRGLMELIVLNIGLDLGVLSPSLFAMMVLMALVTTLMTAPVLHLLRWHEPGTKGSVGLSESRNASGWIVCRCTSC